MSGLLEMFALLWMGATQVQDPAFTVLCWLTLAVFVSPVWMPVIGVLEHRANKRIEAGWTAYTPPPKTGVWADFRAFLGRES